MAVVDNSTLKLYSFSEALKQFIHVLTERQHGNVTTVIALRDKDDVEILTTTLTSTGSREIRIMYYDDEIYNSSLSSNIDRLFRCIRLYPGEYTLLSGTMKVKLQVNDLRSLNIYQPYYKVMYS